MEAETLRLEQVRRRLEVRDGDLSGSTFTDVKMSGSTFRDVNLSALRISDANLTNTAIADCRLDGMTIDGILVTELLAVWRAAHSK
jgi:uncharacterized protein YjbI with pentapeptide repeats